MSRFTGRAFPGARRLLRAVKRQEAAMRNYAATLGRTAQLHDQRAPKPDLEAAIARTKDALMSLRQANHEVNEMPIPFSTIRKA